jgi:hypothetical protein
MAGRRALRCDRRFIDASGRRADAAEVDAVRNIRSPATANRAQASNQLLAGEGQWP